MFRTDPFYDVSLLIAVPRPQYTPTANISAVRSG